MDVGIDFAEALKQGIVSWFTANTELSQWIPWRGEAPADAVKPYVVFALTGDGSERYSNSQAAKIFRVTFIVVGDEMATAEGIAGLIALRMDGLTTPEMILPAPYTLRDFGDPIRFGEQLKQYAGGSERAETVLFRATVDGPRRKSVA